MSTASANMTSPFLQKLPLEIRHEIYRHLVGRHTKTDHAMNSKAWKRVSSSTFCTDHSYRFHDSILRVNQQTRREALDILESETLLVSLLLPKPAELSGHDIVKEITECGVVVINREDLDYFSLPYALNIVLADRFKPTDESMTLDFTAADLPAACVYLQRRIQEANNNSRDAYLRVVACPCMIEAASLLQDHASPKVGTKLSKCLEPLRHLRGASQVDIDGHTSHYTAALIAAITDRRRSAKETMELVAAHMDRGDQYLLQGASRLAIAEYKNGCHAIESRGFDQMETNEELVGGRFHGLPAGWARNNAKVQLHTKIASTYLQLGQLRMARIYVTRIWLPLAAKDNRGHLLKFSLDLPDDENTKVYAELFFVAARISIAAGNECEAQEELDVACWHDPDRKDIARLLEQCQIRAKDRRERREKRRQKTEDGQRRSAQKQYDFDVQCASNRIAKADKLCRVNGLLEAQELYEAAYQKVKYYSYHEPAKTLTVDSLTKLTRLSMEIQDDEAVRHWVDTIFAIHHQYSDYGEYYIWTDMYYTIEAVYTAYYSKAVMLQRQGKITAAIRNFEAALKCDGGCHATYYQLECLKQQETEEDIKRYRDARWPEWEKMECGEWLISVELGWAE